MAYCSKCGAYIPDGQEKCLACGFDASEEKRQAENAAAQGASYSTSNEELRKRLEENERRCRELEEKQRLREKLEQERKAQQEQARAWAEQEKQRRESERKQAEWKAYNNARTTGQHRTYTAGGTASKSRVTAIVSYISFLFLIPMFFRPEDRSASFHARQGMRLFIFGLICDAVAWIPVVGQVLQIARIYLMIKGIINAANGRDEPLPYIGRIGM